MQLDVICKERGVPLDRGHQLTMLPSLIKFKNGSKLVQWVSVRSESDENRVCLQPTLHHGLSFPIATDYTYRVLI